MNSHLKLAVKETDGGSVLEATDTHLGNINEPNMQSLESGWTSLFTDGLEAHVEEALRQDR